MRVAKPKSEPATKEAQAQDKGGQALKSVGVRLGNLNPVELPIVPQSRHKARPTSGDHYFKAVVRRIREIAESRGTDFIILVRVFLDDQEPYPLWAGLTPDRYEAHLLERLRTQCYEDLIESLWESASKLSEFLGKRRIGGLMAGAKRRLEATERHARVLQCVRRLRNEGVSRHLAKLASKETKESDGYVRKVIAADKKRTADLANAERRVKRTAG